MCYFLFRFGWKEHLTMRMLASNAFVGGTKILFQEFICTLPRVEGYVWFFPGIYSLNVPYFDVNDFYYSGHLGMNVAFLYEFACQRKNNPTKIWNYIVNFWILMIFTKSFMMVVFRTHYLIDLLAGFCIGLPIVHLADKFSYLFDVKIMGLRKSERKNQIIMFQICEHCGWANPKASNFISKEELKYQHAAEKRLNRNKKD
jgi:hypothetical protein